ncbi:MAG: Hsp20/alpha crystallin family protein [Deltaproteobacteria bacterium]|nr:Hsp20/alpha crystallin family protein [Deltaproteobacteria bacterium]
MASEDKKQRHEEKSANYDRIERSYGSFCRNFRLPEEVETEKAAGGFFHRYPHSPFVHLPFPFHFSFHS